MTKAIALSSLCAIVSLGGYQLYQKEFFIVKERACLLWEPWLLIKVKYLQTCMLRLIPLWSYGDSITMSLWASPS